MIPFSYSGELWLGLENLSRLTSEGNYSLRITLEDFDRKSYVAVFDQFKVITMMILMLALMTVMVQVGPGDDYVLKVGGFDGPFSTLGDSMTIHSLDGMRFSTRYEKQTKNVPLTQALLRDRDNDNSREVNCADKYTGG